MKNKLFWGLVTLVVVVLAFLVWGALGGLQDLAFADPVAAVCTLALLFVAFLAWEFLMKPGYGWLHRRQDDEGSGEEPAEEPPSTGPP